MGNFVVVYCYILLIIILLTNLFLTMGFIDDEEEFKILEDIGGTEQLIKASRKFRKHLLLESIVVAICVISTTLLNGDKDVYLTLAAMLSVLFVTKIFRIISSIKSNRARDEFKIVREVMDITEEVKKLNLPRQEEEKIFEERILEFIAKNKLSVKKFNKAMKNLDNSMREKYKI